METLKEIIKKQDELIERLKGELDIYVYDGWIDIQPFYIKFKSELSALKSQMEDVTDEDSPRVAKEWFEIWLKERCVSESHPISQYKDLIIEILEEYSQPANKHTVTDEIKIIEFPNDNYKYDATKSSIKVITEIELCECGHISPLGFINYDSEGVGMCVNCLNDVLIDRLVKKNKQIKRLKAKAMKTGEIKHTEK